MADRRAPKGRKGGGGTVAILGRSRYVRHRLRRTRPVDALMFEIASKIDIYMNTSATKLSLKRCVHKIHTSDPRFTYVAVEDAKLHKN